MKSSKSRPWLAKMLTILSSPLLSPRWLSQSEFHGLQPPVINWQSYNQILNQQAVPCRQAPGNNSIIHRRLLITDTITVRPAQLSRLISPSDINCTIFLINLCLSHLQPEAYQKIRENIFFRNQSFPLKARRKYPVINLGKETIFSPSPPPSELGAAAPQCTSSLSGSASSAGGNAGDDITANIFTAG